MLIFDIRSLHILIARVPRLSMVCFVSFKISVTEKGFIQIPPAYALDKAKFYRELKLYYPIDLPKND